MSTYYVDTGGAATNSGSTDQNTANLSGTGDATVAGSVVTLTAGTDLSGVVTTAGPTQSTIYLAQATNANQKIFKISAVAGSGGATPTVTVTVAPTGVTGSNWAIGGRFVWTNASLVGGLVAGDIVQFNNSPASASADLITGSAGGDGTSGPIKFIGKTGTRPVLTVSNTNQVFESTNQFNWLENVEAVQQGASGTVLASSGADDMYYNVKISDGGGNGIGGSGSGCRVMACEITGVGGDGIATSNGLYICGNNIHDNTGNGITFSGTTTIIIDGNVIDSNGGRGIVHSGATGSVSISQMAFLNGNTVYGNGNSGLEVTDKDIAFTLLNNIFAENGNAAGEYNLEWLESTAEATGIHKNNVFFHSGGGGGANLSLVTADSTDITTDPLFTNAAGADFSLGSTSPAKAAGFPASFLGGNTNYRDIGAVQRQEPSSSTSTGTHLGGARLSP